MKHLFGTFLLIITVNLKLKIISYSHNTLFLEFEQLHQVLHTNLSNHSRNFKYFSNLINYINMVFLELAVVGAGVAIYHNKKKKKQMRLQEAESAAAASHYTGGYKDQPFPSPVQNYGQPQPYPQAQPPFMSGAHQSRETERSETLPPYVSERPTNQSPGYVAQDYYGARTSQEVPEHRLSRQEQLNYGTEEKRQGGDYRVV